jgi:hypothetical protein
MTMPLLLAIFSDKRLTLLSVFLLQVCLLRAEEPFTGFERFFTEPHHYVAAYAPQPPVIDGDIDDAVWQKALWTEEFRDIEGALSKRPVPYYKTQAKILWDKDYVYVAANLEEKHIWSYLLKRDEIVYYDNDFEVFIDPNQTAHHYFEFEVNASNTMFDLFLAKPYRDPGGKMLISWDSKGIKHAVKLFGTKNHPADEDKRWTVEMAIPFKDIEAVPKDKDIWRMNFSRVEWETDIEDGKYVHKKNAAGKRQAENNWVWSPTGEINMHCPERWAYVMFSAVPAGGALPALVLPKTELLRRQLWYIYYKQRQYRREHKVYAASLEQLQIKSTPQLSGETCTLSMEATADQWTATAAGFAAAYVITYDGRIAER